MNINAINNYIIRFTLKKRKNHTEKISTEIEHSTKIENISIGKHKITKYINEFWTSKQRQANAIHEISYRACFKPQLPAFFINLLSREGDIVYDPFSGRGTTIIEAALKDRNVISNDINPLSEILCRPRLFIPSLNSVSERLMEIPILNHQDEDIDLFMFYHHKTLSEILSLKGYLYRKRREKKEDHIDSWIRMVATNRLTGHSKGFFSVYTLPPNQAVSPKRQIEFNSARNQKPEYRNVKMLILKKSKSLIRSLTEKNYISLRDAGSRAIFLNCNANKTSEIDKNQVTLTVTSPPFLDIVQYHNDNWLRCWFNDIDSRVVQKNITMSKNIDVWIDVMFFVFKELFRITKKNGFVAFEVGEIRSGKLNLEKYVVEIGIRAGFKCIGIMKNKQKFTKTANIWGISNNKKGTNSNRIVIFVK
jgi:DNA modification methylase